MAKRNQEVVLSGWLTKSPPTKRIWRSRWRRRWFSLMSSGDIPGQFVLTYYTDKNCRHLKGTINLDHCEQVDLGLKLEKRKLKFDHVFNIQTPTRTYYLAADTDTEMKSWVKTICTVCGLTSCTGDDNYYGTSSDTPDIEVIEEESTEISLQRNISNSPKSPASSSLYIPISECITGKSPVFDKQDFKSLLEHNMKNSIYKQHLQLQNDETYELSHKPHLNYVNDIFDPRFYDSPRQLIPRPNTHPTKNASPMQSPTDSENVFTDEDWVINTSADKKVTRLSDSSADLDLVATQRFTRGANAPPRPPKPSKIGNSPNHLNLTLPTSTPVKDNNGESKVARGSGDQQIMSDDMYDFPRSHQIDNDAVLRQALAKRHCYNNAAPVKIEGQIFRYDISPKPSTSATQMFRYDSEDTQDEPASPHSQSSSTTGYSNLPSPLLAETQLMPPPAVHRDLKPRRKLSDSHSLSSNPEPPSPRGAPSIDRKLKPQDAHLRKTFSTDEESKRIRAAPSPTPGANHSFENLYSNDETVRHVTGKMQYLDLDLDCNISCNPAPASGVPEGGNTVYKQVDFIKTQAFNITRNNLEKERQEPLVFHKK